MVAWVSVDRVTDLLAVLLVHMPMYISVLLTLVASQPTRSALRASSSCDLVVLQTRRRIGDRAFSVATPWAWNRLPTQLNLLCLTTAFLRQLKTFLSHSAYRHWETDWWLFVTNCDAPSVFSRGAIQMTQLQLLCATTQLNSELRMQVFDTSESASSLYTIIILHCD